jgi:hypothetical protein
MQRTAARRRSGVGLLVVVLGIRRPSPLSGLQQEGAINLLFCFFKREMNRSSQEKVPTKIQSSVEFFQKAMHYLIFWFLIIWCQIFRDYRESSDYKKGAQYPTKCFYFIV